MYWGQWPSFPTFVSIYFCNLKQKKIIRQWMDNIYSDVKKDIVFNIGNDFRQAV